MGQLQRNRTGMKTDLITPAAPGELARPSAGQMAWQDLELGAFYHFDLHIIQNGIPNATPDDYPETFDADQWMEAAKAMGAKYAIFTSKHGSGFLQWQSDAYAFGLTQSKWRGGKGDAVREFADACRRAGIRPGIYHHVSWTPQFEVAGTGKVNWGKGGDPEKQKRYAAVCEKLLAELWSNYGEWVECWFDSGVLPLAEGGPDVAPLAARLQPQAMFFQGPVSTIRWIGNEDGVAGYPCWATVPGREVELQDGNAAQHGKTLLHGDPDGRLWLPGECDAPLPGHEWDWKPSQPEVEPLPRLMDIYLQSVGRNSNLLLNVTPNAQGLVPEQNLRYYADFGREIRRRFGTPVAEARGEGALVQLDLTRPARIGSVILMEDIAHGERVREYVVEGLVGADRWQRLCDGTSVGHKRIQEFPAVEVAALRFRALRHVASPRLRRFAAFAG